MNYQIEFKNDYEFKKAVKKLQELTNYSLSKETKQQLYGGLFKNKRFCIALSGYTAILTCTEGYGTNVTTIKLRNDTKYIKYNKYLLK